MKSTDHNINDPTCIGTIPFHRYVESWELPTIEYISKEGYDLMNVHDPYIMYIITDVEPRLMYYGDIEIKQAKAPKTYYMTTRYLGDINEYEYVIYVNTKDGSPHNGDNLIEICKFNNAQDAINALHLYNSAGSHSFMGLQINKILSEYILRHISIHDCIVGLISSYGDRNHPGLQSIIQMGVTYGTKHTDVDLPVLLREEIKNMRGLHPFVTIYANIYDVFVKYNLFRDKLYIDIIGTPKMVPILKDVFIAIIGNSGDSWVQWPHSHIQGI